MERGVRTRDKERRTEGIVETMGEPLIVNQPDSHPQRGGIDVQDPTAQFAQSMTTPGDVPAKFRGAARACVLPAASRVASFQKARDAKHTPPRRHDSGPRERGHRTRAGPL